MTTLQPHSADRPLRDDPVIVLGMHHSGTSILAESLHRNGIFMHANMHHSESKFFTRLNNNVLLGAGGWARLPLPSVDEIMAKRDEVCGRIARRAMRKYIDEGYDGTSRWGFKDPRTCVVLPLYLELFPNAQLLHIIRDEDDVAASLAARPKKGLGLITDLSFWKELRRQYITRAREYGSRHRCYLEVSYEDFCMGPQPVMAQICEFLATELQPSTRQFLATQVYRHRVGIGRSASGPPASHQP